MKPMKTYLYIIKIKTKLMKAYLYINKLKQKPPMITNNISTDVNFESA